MYNPKLPRRYADHSHPSGAEVKKAWTFTSTHPYVLMASDLLKHMDNFTFNLTSTIID
jgi:hypothetical protein